MCLTQNQHTPDVHSGKIAVNSPPHCSHHLFSAPSESRVLVMKSSRSKSTGMGFGPTSGISVGVPKPLRRDHPISTDSIVAVHNSPFLFFFPALDQKNYHGPSRTFLNNIQYCITTITKSDITTRHDPFSRCFINGNLTPSDRVLYFTL